MTETDNSISQALDRVYAARPSEFVAERKKIVAELRAAGDREGAAKVAAAHRPTATAWAINHVVRKNPDMVARFTDAIEALRKAQRALLEGKASPNENAKLRAERNDLDQRTAEFLNLARGALESENVNWNVTTQRRIATSLRTLPSATAEDRERLLAGRLEKDLDTGDEDSLLETALGLSGVEIRPKGTRPTWKRAPAQEVPQKKPDHAKPAQSKEEAHKAKIEEQRQREKERHEREEKTRRAAEQLARERAHAQRLKFLEREAEHLESKATYAEEAAVKARAASDVAKVALKKAKEQKP